MSNDSSSYVPPPPPPVGEGWRPSSVPTPRTDSGIHEPHRATFVPPATAQNPDETSIDTLKIPVEPTTTEEVDLDDVNTEPQEQSDRFVLRIAEGFALGFAQIREELKELIVEVVHEVLGNEQRPEEEEYIGYDHRQHFLAFVGRLVAPVLIFLIATSVYVLFTGNIFATSIAVLLLGVGLWWVLRFIAKRRSGSTKTRNRFVRTLIVGAYVLTDLILCAALAFLLEFFGVGFGWSFGYLLFSSVMIYLVFRLHYMWAYMRISRSGSTLSADRPRKDIYFLPTLNRTLDLYDVKTYRSGQSWIEELIGVYHLDVDISSTVTKPILKSSTKEREAYREFKFWTNLKFIPDGPQLIKAMKQGMMIGSVRR